MPWSPKQNKLFRAIEHGWTPPASAGIHIKRKDATRMAHEGVKRARGGIELAVGGMPQPGDQNAPDLPYYSYASQNQPGVQLAPWSQLDPFQYTGAPVMLADGGSPGDGVSGILQYLASMRRSPGGGGGNRPPPSHGGTIGTISSDVDPGVTGDTSDPKFGAMDPRTRALARINQHLQKESSLSGAQSMTESVMARNFGSKPTLESYAPLNYRAMNPYNRGALDTTTQLLARGLARGGRVPRFADGGRLIDFLKKLPRSERWGYLKENRLRDITGENAMFRGLGSPASPVQMHGGIPDFKVKNPAFMPRSRQRFMLYDSSVPKPGTNSALELGSIATNVGDIKGGRKDEWLPKDLIDIDLHKPARGEGYGKETLAMLLSSMPHEGAQFPLYDVKRSAKSYWDSLGAQLRDPSQPFRQKDKRVFDAEGIRDMDRSQFRNNDYYLTPGDFLENVDKFAEGGSVRPNLIWDDDDLHERLVVRRMAGGGETGSGGADLALLGAGLAASRLRPRHINSLVRPFSRAFAKPMMGVEAVSGHPLSGRESDLRFENARSASGDFSDLPVHRGQGAWAGERGMEYNPLYMQELPRTFGRVRDYQPGMRYASQMGENLEQAATPVSRFVPHAINTPDDANAMMVHGVDDPKLRRMAELLGPDVVTAHRPGNRAMVMPLGDQRLPDLETEINAGFGFPKIRYGRSDPDVDRVLLARKPLGYESGLYSDYGAKPRDAAFADRERQALSGSRMLEVFDRLRGAEVAAAKGAK